MQATRKIEKRYGSAFASSRKRPHAWRLAHIPSLTSFLNIKQLGISGRPRISLKVLRVTVQSNLKWDFHVNEIVGKSSKRLHILRVLKRSGAPPHRDLLRVYFALIKSVLEYCCPVWHFSLSAQISERIERVQKRTLRIIFPVSLYEDALKLSGCTTLCARRDLLCAKTFEKIKEPGSRLHHLIPPTRAPAHGRSLHFKDRPSLMKCKTERFEKSFFPHVF